MKKLFLLLFLLCLLTVAYISFNRLFPKEEFNAIFLIPEDAVYILETDEPIKAWREVSGSKLWKHLRKQPYFNELTNSADELYQIIEANPAVFQLIGTRTVAISAHVYQPKTYDFLYLIDLENAAKLQVVQGYLEHIPLKNYTIKQRTFKNQSITEFVNTKDNSSIFVSFIGNFLLCSFQKKLIEDAITQKDQPTIALNPKFTEINNLAGTTGLFRLYMQYAYIDEYMQCYLQNQDQYINSLSKSLMYSGANFRFEEDGNVLNLKGYTNINDSANSFVKALLLSGRGQLKAQAVIPQRTAFYFSLSCADYDTFFSNFENTLQASNEWDEYKANIEKAEKFLNISVKKNFIDWIGQEITVVQTQPKGLGKDNELALIFKAKNIDLAKENLHYIAEQVRKRTPVKFRELDYNGYKIGYLSVKGFFRLFLGSFFEKLEKPYFTVIEDYVIFSNHPQTIKNIINDYVAGNTLAKSPEFEEFIDKFKEASNVFVYTKTPILKTTLKNYVSAQTWQQLNTNQPYIACFQQIGFQLSAENDVFATQFSSTFTDDFSKLNPLPPAPVPVLDSAALPEPPEIELEDLGADVYEEKFPNGKIKIEAKIKNGKKHGYYTEYFANGEKKVKGEYANDLRHGTWRYYDEYGTVLRKREFENGVEVRD